MGAIGIVSSVIRAHVVHPSQDDNTSIDQRPPAHPN